MTSLGNLVLMRVAVAFSSVIITILSLPILSQISPNSISFLRERRNHSRRAFRSQMNRFYLYRGGTPRCRSGKKENLILLHSRVCRPQVETEVLATRSTTKLPIHLSILLFCCSNKWFVSKDSGTSGFRE